MFRRTSFVLFLLLALSSIGVAQNTTATLRGTVHDASGAAVPGAAVTVTNTGTHSDYKSVTNNTGDYTVVQLPIGSYTVTVTANGFDTGTYTGIILNVDQNARVDATLKVGSLSQTVAVDATAIQIQSEDAVNGKLLSGRELQELPSNNRNIWQEAQYLPQVSADPPSDSLANRGGFIVAGIVASNNNYLLDGNDDNDWTTGQPTLRPSTDAVSDYRIISGQAPAEYGSKNGGQIVVNTRSGTNNWHGGAFFFYRDGKWNAPLYNFQYPIIPAVPTSVSRQFGGSFGGPIFKDRSFFWATYEGTRAAEDPAVSGTTALNAWKGGTYTSDGNAQFTTPIYDPLTGTQFAQSSPGIWEVPASRITPQAQLLLKYFPQPTQTQGSGANAVGTFANHLPNTQNENQGTLRYDEKFGQNDSVFAVYSILYGRQTGTVGDFVVANAVVPGFGATSPHLYQQGTIGWNHIFTPNLINSFRIGFNRFDAYYKNQDASLGNVVGALGLPQGGNYLEPPTYGNTGVPSIGITSLSSIGTGGNPQWRGDNTVPLSESLTWVHGNHTFKTGFSILDFFKHSFYIPGGRGTYSFTGQYTDGGSAGAGTTAQTGFADFLLGYIQTDSYQTGIENQYPVQHSGGLYAEDAWKVVPSLTVSYGLRWDYFGPVREAYNNISYFNSTTNLVYTGKGQVYNLNTPGTPLYNSSLPSGSLNQVGSVPTRRDNYAGIYHNFAPRIGFDYRVNNSESTVIRGGYGIYYGIPSIQTWNSANGLGTPYLIPYSYTSPVPNSATHIAPASAYLLGPTAFGSAGTQGLNTIGVTTIDPHIKTLYTQQYSLGIQYQLGKIALLEVTYQGSHTVHNVSTLSINQPTLATRQLYPVNTNANSVSNLRPFNTIGSNSAWGSISTLSSGLSANYNSLLVSAQRRFENGLTFQSYLTYSKALEEGSLVNDPAYPASYNYGPSSYDQKFRSVTTGLYHLPFGDGQRFLRTAPSLVRYAVGGWQATAVLTLQSGRPFSSSTNDTYASFTGNGGHAFINPGGGNPNAKTDSVTLQKTHTVKNWFNTGAFRSNSPLNGAALTNNNAATIPYVYAYGDGGYNNIRGPGLQDVDFGLLKEVKLRNTQSVEFKAEAFNILNHPNFTNPTAVYGGTGGKNGTTSTTGVITSTVASGTATATGANRQLQLSLRYAF